MKTESYDVMIAGGGMTGLTMALALARAGLNIAVIERMPYTTHLEPAFDGRVSAIALGSKRVLSALGAWEAMQPFAEPILDIRVSDADAPFFLHYDHQEVGDMPFGWIVENRYIRKALVDAVASHDSIHVLAPAAVSDVQAEEAFTRVVLRDGRELKAPLLIGADGKSSEVREFAGIRAIQSEYGQTAIVCTIAHTLPHHGLAQERFLAAGPFAVLPMQRNRSSLVWTERSEHAPVFLRLPEGEFVQEVRERVGAYLGNIAVEGPRFSYPLTLVHAERYAAPRIALIGDAAHAIHPIAGQGVNLGFRDVAVLAELLGRQAASGLDLGDAQMLRHYQRWRRFDNVAMLTVTDGLNRLFSNRLLPLKLARGLGLFGVSKLPPLKRLFMRHAMGLTGDLPPLMRDAA